MKVAMLLADWAEALNGKLYIQGGGWSITGPDPTPSAIAIKIEVPWTEANRRHKLMLELQDADGRAVRLPAPPPNEGDAPLQIQGEFEVGRPAGLPAGTPLDAVLAINISPLPLAPGARYVWRLSIDGESRDEWTVAFNTRTARPAPGRPLGR